jgi:hypothetical protein
MGVAGILLGSVATLAIVYGRGATPARMAAPGAAPSSVVPGDQKTPILPGASAAAPPPAEPVTSATAEVTRVTLEVFPPNAKVTYAGGGFTGPVGEIDIPRGRRVALQIAHKGYATRRLVLDGSKPKVAIGLVKQPAQ